MLDSEPKTRRATDVLDNAVCHTPEDAWSRAGLAHIRIGDTNADVANLKTRIDALEKAFIKNDILEPDYEGHRLDHRTRLEATRMLDSYKTDATKKVFTGGVMLVLALIFAGLIDYLKAQLK